jgi:alkanesulfonate monooxygenase SsuD/methylene tetrahydromethanopterin reductase-like flavin-dependent oxidoreductase (luciferase family)
MSGLATLVPRVRIGTLVCGNTYRHPAVLAKQAATVDHQSGGRVVLGLGAGWQVNEHRSYGIDFFDVKERLARLDEACRLVKGLFTDERTTFDGRYYTLTDAPLEPKPLQQPLPLLVGGGGEKVTMRIAATWADEWNVWSTPDVMRQKMDVLRGHCDRLGRDPSEIAVSTQALLLMSDDESWLASRRPDPDAPAPRPPVIVGTPAEVVDIVGAYADAGVDELIVPDWTLGRGERRRDTYDRFMQDVIGVFSLQR